jgi:hypothetical protein
MVYNQLDELILNILRKITTSRTSHNRSVTAAGIKVNHIMSNF